MNTHPRRVFLKTLGLAGGLITLTSCSADKLLGLSTVLGRVQPGALASLETVNLLSLLHRPLEHNVLKLFRAVADPVRNRVYVSGIMTPHIGILDGLTEQWIGTVDSQIQGSALKYLALDPVANRLYVRDATNNNLLAVSLDTDKILATVSIPKGAGTILPDSKRSLVYVLTREQPSFRALDGATLKLVYSSSEMGDGINQAVYDEQSDMLYLLDAAQPGPRGRIFRFDPAQRSLAGTIEYPLPPGQRARVLAWTSQGFIVAIPNRHFSVLTAQGNEIRSIPMPRELEFQDMLYDPNSKHLLALFIEKPAAGQVSGVNGHLRVYDPNNGQMVSELTFGKKVHSLTLNSATGRVYLPNGDASVVWSVSSDHKSVTPLRLGDSLEQVVPALGGRLLFMNSRLGGSYLMAYDVEGKSLETFEAGTWPIPIRTDATGERLFVLNAWDSTLSVYTLSPTRTLTGTVLLGLPPGTTDRLPDLAIDSLHQRAYAAYPEFGKIVVADWKNMKPVTVISVQGFPTGDEGGGPGQLQVAVNEQAGRLFAFWSRQRRLSVFETENYRLLDEVILPKPASKEGSNANLMFFDREKNRLFAGPVELDGVTGRPTGRELARGQRVFALDQKKKLYWADAVEHQGQKAVNVVVALDRETLRERAVYVIGPASTVVPEYALDTERGRLYVGQMTTVQLEIYATTD